MSFLLVNSGVRRRFNNISGVLMGTFALLLIFLLSMYTVNIESVYALDVTVDVAVDDIQAAIDDVAAVGGGVVTVVGSSTIASPIYVDSFMFMNLNIPAGVTVSWNADLDVNYMGSGMGCFVAINLLGEGTFEMVGGTIRSVGSPSSNGCDALIHSYSNVQIKVSGGVLSAGGLYGDALWSYGEVIISGGTIGYGIYAREAFITGGNFSACPIRADNIFIAGGSFAAWCYVSANNILYREWPPSLTLPYFDAVDTIAQVRTINVYKAWHGTDVALINRFGVHSVRWNTEGDVPVIEFVQNGIVVWSVEWGVYRIVAINITKTTEGDPGSPGEFVFRVQKVDEEGNLLYGSDSRPLYSKDFVVIGQGAFALEIEDINMFGINNYHYYQVEEVDKNVPGWTVDLHPEIIWFYTDDGSGFQVNVAVQNKRLDFVNKFAVLDIPNTGVLSSLGDSLQSISEGGAVEVAALVVLTVLCITIVMQYDKKKI